MLDDMEPDPAFDTPKGRLIEYALLLLAIAAHIAVLWVLVHWLEGWLELPVI